MGDPATDPKPEVKPEQKPPEGPDNKALLDRLEKLAGSVEGLKATLTTQHTEHQGLFKGLADKLVALTPKKDDGKPGDKKDQTTTVPVVVTDTTTKPAEKPKRSWLDRLLG
jgi:hypothetical protein